MNVYNLPSTAKIEQSDRPINTRAKLDTGTFCNYACNFCYYYDKLHEITSLDVIKERIDYIAECGMTEVDLSGGESSVHKEWFKILDYCTEKGLRISCLSNGFKFADIEFLKKSREHGLREILFSLHGYDEVSHDKIVGRKNAFKRMIKAIQNCHELGIIVRFNCTVTKDNFKQLDNEYVDLVNSLQPQQINFLTLNHWDDANKIETFSYNESTPAIKSSIDKLNVPEIVVRYTPYCFMQGYEHYVCNTYHHIHDVKDWNIAIYNHTLDPDLYKKDPRSELYKKANENRNMFYTKQKECLKCKYYYICDGYEKVIKEISLTPISGIKLQNLFPETFA